jgi:ribosome maturation factor RimP
MSIKHFTAAVAAVGLIASLPAGAIAAKAPKTDPDRDGLSNKVEKRLGTNARRADTDRDKLKDGAEVRLGTNPRAKDSDKDGVSDGREVAAGTDPCSDHANEVRGAVASVGTDSVTITKLDATTVTLTVNSATKLRIPDTDGSGTVTLADLKAGDKVKAHTSATDATLAVSISVKGAYQKGDEVEGAVSAVGANSLTVTKEDGTSATVNVDAATKLRAPDRDGSGTITLADILAGDKVEIYLSAADPTLALSVKVEAKGTKVAGTVAAIGADSVTITLADLTTKTVTVNSSTKLRIPAADGTPTGTLADLKLGDPVKAKTVVGAEGTTLALCLSAGVFASEDRSRSQENRGQRGDDRRGGRGRGGRDR